MPSSKDKYTDPKLRDEVKEEVQQSDKGGAPGQWSARKAQFMAKEYKSRGGGYKTDKKDQDESQKHLSKWTEEEWQTKDGSGDAKQDDGTRKRYLPKKAWEEMSEKEKDETEEVKQQGSKAGKQYVPNTSRARSARKKANDDEDEAFEKKKEQEKNEGTGKQTRSKSRKAAAEEQPNGKQDSPPKKAGQKRVRGTETKADAEEKPPNKKQKDNTESVKGKNKGTGGSKPNTSRPPAKQTSKASMRDKNRKVH
ncbi:hypothetical protein A1O7_02278 [Cladophialophora yegresii CBS 114405]|uniref:DUF5872 domain-containing protein n=1 Tax=Cladophialophora yegresii CBS 114405 TaxID=1182544 RepID=W9W1P1_9EURO|nr:uncharacterized protein A1O7_02278 [Cladophialophora yegresii CBS 114405]EXJ61848.1 hypothetical protein A1O7_02278 [Cladophialophora yegresii CBS 114405]